MSHRLRHTWLRFQVFVAALIVGIQGGHEVAPLADFAIAERYPHQSGCFTEGLMLLDGSSNQPEVVESCGLYGASYVRRYDLKTGETLQQGAVPAAVFGEGLTIVGDKLYLLTWRSHVVYQYDARTLEQVRSHSFPYGEGWGLTTDGCDLLASTGSSNIYRFRIDDDGGLSLVSTMEVTYNGAPVRMLNELEYVTPKLWVNEWHTNRLWRVHPYTGVAELQIDVASLYAWSGESTPNGIAYLPSLDVGYLVVTGKQWSQMMALNLSSSDLCGGSSSSPPSCVAAPRSACWTPRESAGVAIPGSPAEAVGPKAVGLVASTRPVFRNSQAGGVFTTAATTLAFVLAVGGAVMVPLFLIRQHRRLRYASLEQTEELAALQ